MPRVRMMHAASTPAMRAIGWFLAAFVSGCAGSAEHAALEKASAALERARSAPRVRAHAALQLDSAELALERARAASAAGAPPDQVEHLAYVASQRAAFAEAQASAQVARSEIGVLQRALGHIAAAPRAANAQQERPSDGVAANAASPAQEFTLSLAELSFEGAEPTGAALEELEALAERLRREPSRSVVIEAEFDLPDPEARTTIERRVEVVRAIILERGIAPARLRVRARGAAATEWQALPSLVEPAA